MIILKIIINLLIYYTFTHFQNCINITIQLFYIYINYVLLKYKKTTINYNKLVNVIANSSKYKK